jgi:hypothetical protein
MRILLENNYLPGILKKRIEPFMVDCNPRRRFTSDAARQSIRPTASRVTSLSTSQSLS